MVSTDIFKIFAAVLILGSSIVQGFLHGDGDFLARLDDWECPDPAEFVEANSNYTMTCVEASLPPWPLCVFHEMDYFIDAAIASANRCCDFDNFEECKCPFKNKWWWQRKMEGWCADIETCPESNKDVAAVNAMMETEAWAKFLR